MLMDDRWDKLSDDDWSRFARGWIEELRGASATDEHDIRQSVVMMNFTARPEHQWRFILAALRFAEDDELGHIAAGPLEHLLGRFGDQYIDQVERMAESDSKFAKTICGVWRYMMADDIWERIQALQSKHGASKK